MEKMNHDGTVYRLKPTKRYPKGLRIRVATYDQQDHHDPNPDTRLVLVCAVRDGHQFFISYKDFTELKAEV